MVLEGIAVQCFDRPAGALMEFLAAVVEHRAVGHFLREGVLKEILHLRQCGLFVEELFALQGR